MIEHTIEKINKEWFIWNGTPKVLRAADAVAGPFTKRYHALEAASQLSMAKILATSADGDHT